jgi:NAD-dependent dihydropyrimidine dehydrogenase PreA subunit
MNAAGIYPIRAVRGEQCTGCASCYRVCPDTAITVYELEGEG